MPYGDPADPVPAALLAPVAELYLDLHRHPELSGAEARTAGRLADHLAVDGYAVTRGVGGHGVVGVLRNGPGPVVLLRTELDALPVREETGLPYASTVTAPGPDGVPVPVMHACGHDVHMACAAGAATALARTRRLWSGTLLVVGQPAEETLTGAAAMLADGLYTRFPAPDVVLAQHAVPLPAGMVAHADGPLLAASATVEVVLHGRGGHAGAPQLAVDPVVTAAATVLRLQTVVSRETGPGEPLVLTVGALRAGGPGNVIADRATMEVTLRAFSAAGLDRALDGRPPDRAGRGRGVGRGARTRGHGGVPVRGDGGRPRGDGRRAAGPPGGLRRAPGGAVAAVDGHRGLPAARPGRRPAARRRGRQGGLLDARHGRARPVGGGGAGRRPAAGRAARQPLAALPSAGAAHPGDRGARAGGGGPRTPCGRGGVG